MRARGLVSMLLCFALGCATSAPLPTHAERNLEWLQQMLSREVALPNVRILSSSDGRFETVASAQLIGPIEANETGNYVLGLDMGTGAPIHCVVYPDALDPAATLQQIASVAFGGMADHYDSLEGTWIENVDAGAVAGHATLSASWIYRALRDGQPVAGQLKQKIAANHSSTIYCHHDQLGFAKNFERVFDQLVENLSFAHASPASHYYEEIVVFDVEGKRIGVMHTYLTRDADGDTRTEQASSFLVPRDASHFFVRDAYSVEYSTPRGALINQLYVESESGRLATQLELLPRGPDSWRVRGLFKGRELETDFAAEGPLSSVLGEMLVGQSIFGSENPQREHQMQRWLPDTSPENPVAASYRFGKPDDDGTVEAELTTGPYEAQRLIDPSGSAISGLTRMGSTEVRFERVYQRGTF